MKLLYIHKNVDAKELKAINGNVDLPSDIEVELCSLLDSKSEPLIKLWSEFSSKYFDDSRSIFRDSASGVKIPKTQTTLGTLTPSTIKGQDSIRVYQTGFTFDESIDLSEYSIFAVAKVADFVDAATTCHLFGQVGAADSSNYGPSIGFSNGGRLNVYKGLSVTSRLSHAGVDYRNIAALFAVTFSTDNGLSLRVNGSQVAIADTDKNAVTSPKLPIKLLGNFSGTGGFQGDVAEIIVTNRDLLKDKNSLAKIENYLKSKYTL